MRARLSTVSLRLLLLAVAVLVVLLAGCGKSSGTGEQQRGPSQSQSRTPTSTAPQESFPIKEGDFTASQLARSNKEGQVEVDVVFLNPILEKKQDDLVFLVMLNTHSVSLSGYKLEQMAILKNSKGVSLSQGLRWVSEQEGDHHRSGYLVAPSKTPDGKPLVDSETEFIILELKGIGEVASRSFKWEKQYLRF